MIRLFRIIIVATAASAALAGCVARGHYFNRTQIDDFVLGRATIADVQAALGEPYSMNYRAVASADPRPARPDTAFPPMLLGGSYAVLTYLYLDRSKAPLIGTYYSDKHTPGKLAILEFWNGQLISYTVLSDADEDSSEFDETKVGALLKGTTTRAEVLQMLGPPSGRSVAPHFPQHGGDSFIYHHVDVDRRHFEERRKRLDVLFGDDDVVQDFRFVTDVKPIPRITTVADGYSIVHNLDYYLGRKTGW